MGTIASSKRKDGTIGYTAQAEYLHGRRAAAVKEARQMAGASA
jgi:hypothetical protein